jgi:WD40 repeat protein
MKTAHLLQLCIVVASLTPLPQVTAQDWTAVFAPQGCVARTVDAKPQDYASWIAPYTKRFDKGATARKQDVELSLTILDGDNLAPDRPGTLNCQMSTTYSVSSSGRFSLTRVTPMAVQGGGPGRLPTEKLQTIQKLMVDLLRHSPDDHATLPPPGRRLVLSVQGGNRTVARVYDRADIPQQVQEILGFIGATTGPMWMDFRPSVITQDGLDEPPIPVDAVGIRVLHHRDPATNGLRPDTATLAVSPGGSMIVTRYFFSNPRTVVTDRNGTTILFAVSEHELNRREIYVSHAFFTPDSRYLLLLSNLPAIRIYDTKTWKSVRSLHGLPAGATAFYPSSDWKHGVAVLQTGEADAWDILKGQKQSELHLEGDLQEVSFSDDDSLFAASSVRHNKDSSSIFHLRVWDTNTGQFVREMVPPYYFEHDEIGRPMWWGHGKYLLADTRAGRWGGYIVAIWNVQSGQLRGGFSGCDHSEDSYAVGIHGKRLLKWCRDNTLMVWDIPFAVEKITDFEQSLKRTW